MNKYFTGNTHANKLMKRCLTSGLKDIELNITKMPFYSHPIGRNRKSQPRSSVEQVQGPYSASGGEKPHTPTSESLAISMEGKHLLTLWPSKIPPLSSRPRVGMLHVGTRKYVWKCSTQPTRDSKNLEATKCPSKEDQMHKLRFVHTMEYPSILQTNEPHDMQQHGQIGAIVFTFLRSTQIP